MILLSGHSLTPARKVPLESMSLQLKEKDSSASMTPADMTGITVGSWLRDDTAPGKDIVWRVKSIRQTYATNTPQVDLEHAISLLKDRILFGEVKPSTITGNAKATTCTAQQAVRYILAQQSDWVLGTFGYSVSNPYKFDGDTLFDALETVTDSLADAMWTYDMSVYPFRLNISPKQSGVDSEMRAGRNLKTITKTVDRSGMYTRFYPIGANDLKLTGGGYVEKNVSAYGVVSKVETDASIDTDAELRRWANERLKIHAEPTVTIELEGVELADATGERLDRLTLGRICRVPLPEYGTEIQERIVSLSYQDKVNQPEVVKVTLDNNREDVTKILADAIKRGGKSARTSTKKDKEDLAWFEDTNDHVSMCAKGIIGVDAAGNPNWVRLSEITVDGTGIHQQVQSVQKDVVIASTRIDQNEHAIQMEASQRKSADQSFEGRLSVTATRVGMVVGTKNGRDFIKAAEIAVSINESTGESEAKIDAQKVYIGNTKSTTVIAGKCSLSDVTANYIKTQLATVSQVDMMGANVIGSLYIRNGGGNQQNVNGGIWDLDLSESSGTYTLKRKRFSDTDWVTVGSFSRATTLSGVWNGGEFTVTASPQGNTKKTDLFTAGHWGYASGEVASHYYGSISAHIDGGSTSYSTGAYFEVDGSNLYNNGHDSVVVGEFDLNGNSSATSSTKPTTALNKTPSTISGYKWLQKSDGTWKNLGSFSISTGATHYTVPIYYYSGGSYHKITKNTLCYSDQ